jgi:hypothetical protein
METLFSKFGFVHYGFFVDKSSIPVFQGIVNQFDRVCRFATFTNADYLIFIIFNTGCHNFLHIHHPDDFDPSGMNII